VVPVINAVVQRLNTGYEQAVVRIAPKSATAGDMTSLLRKVRTALELATTRQAITEDQARGVVFQQLKLPGVVQPVKPPPAFSKPSKPAEPPPTEMVEVQSIDAQLHTEPKPMDEVVKKAEQAMMPLIAPEPAPEALGEEPGEQGEPGKPEADDDSDEFDWGMDLD